ncbi:MAG: 2Fe-2S iron-sulfur cluster binding domain-containing protein [Deltaproteobacteria bacterium]|nr:2Fe-2S iron-sulfur cluster binding domain-containing protein [Deltaproteobacteria bacterium]
MPKLTFINPHGKKSLPLTVEAKPGETILDAAEECGARVGHACGGNLACSTCHVYVQQGYDSLPEIHDKENDIMDKAFDVRAESRLGCQCKLGDEDVVVEISEESLRAWLDENPEARKKEAVAAGSR